MTRVAVTTSELLEELKRGEMNDAPPDAMTADELANSLGISKTSVNRRLHRLRVAGRLKSWIVFREDSAGRRQRVAAYTMVPMAPAKKAKR